MDRRELLKMIAVLTGGAVVGAEAFLSGCTNAEKTGAAFSENDIAFLNEVGETILPETKTPGAKAANVGQFMTVYVNDCYEEADQKIFHDGMKKIDEACEKMHGHSFIKSTSLQKHELFVSLDKEEKDYRKEKSEKDKEAKAKDKNAKGLPNHYFTLMKQLTLLGFFTSKEGVTKALRYVPVPGRYEGCIDYKKGDRSFAGLG
jgi:hypothetical protein